MPRKLYYLPLEPYRERYTSQLSAPLVGWYERLWREAQVDYERIDAVTRPELSIGTGQVVDAVGRSIYSFQQVAKLLKLLAEGKITSDDVIFFDDMWTPGLEAIPYLCHQIGVKPKMYAYCWAQSVDEFDFTADMASWMRHFERGIGVALDGIFVASTELKRLLDRAEIGESLLQYDSKVKVVGLPFDSDEVLSRMPEWYRDYRTGHTLIPNVRKNQVVFSSRCDWEKQPELFVRLFHLVKQQVPDATFVVTTSAKQLRSNRVDLLAMLKNTAETNPDFIIKENQTKEEYYATLCESKVQFNCAKQDWVSFTLLEASVAGCFPIYPDFRSFPETFNHCWGFLYPDCDIEDAAKKVVDVLRSEEDLWSPAAIRKRAWIHERMDDSWLRMLDRMHVPISNPEYRNLIRGLSIPYPNYAHVEYKRARPARN